MAGSMEKRNTGYAVYGVIDMMNNKGMNALSIYFIPYNLRLLMKA